MAPCREAEDAPALGGSDEAHVRPPCAGPRAAAFSRGLMYGRRAPVELPTQAGVTTVVASTIAQARRADMSVR